MVTKSLPRGEGAEPPTASVIFPHDRVSSAGFSLAGFSAAFSVLAVMHAPHEMVSKQHRYKRLTFCIGPDPSQIALSRASATTANG
jgi:hypothetical protein